MDERTADDQPATKVCKACGAEKPAGIFGLVGPNRRRNICNPCRSAQRRALYAEDPARPRQAQVWNGMLYRYGLTRERYEEMVSDQGGMCAICGLPPAIKYRRNQTVESRLVVDHCHKTGKIRGLLCNNCNVALGVMLDDPTRLERGAAYLREAG